MQTVHQHQEGGLWNNKNKESKNRQTYLPFTAYLSIKCISTKMLVAGLAHT